MPISATVPPEQWRRRNIPLRGFSRTAAYEVIDLGTLGGSESVAVGINDNGQVAGYSNAASGVRHPFLYTGRGRLKDLGMASDATAGIALGINASGDVAGYYVFGGRAAGPTKGFLYRASTGKVELIPALPGHPISGAADINDSGQVVGASMKKVSLIPPPAHAVLWETRKNPRSVTDLGSLKRGKWSNAEGINNKGQVVGVSAGRGFLHENGRMRALATLSGGKQSYAYALNNKGITVGYALTSSDKCHACLWDNSSGKILDLGVLPGDGEEAKSEAHAINDAGQVVGNSGERLSTDKRAFLWEKGKMHDLNDLIPKDAGWVLTVALGINNHGWIVGAGTLKGNKRAFLLRP